MKINPTMFEVRQEAPVDLRKCPTLIEPFYTSKEHYKDLLAEHVKELQEQQGLLYASGHHAVLLILQGMDTAGKDGVIKHVVSGVNPQGCEVFSFRQPSSEELAHDFLWRSTCRLPERGRIGIFNRSYYEEVLVVRVHPELLKVQGLPDALLDDRSIWKDRYRSIVDLEDHLGRNGTLVIKVFLHLSKDEQRTRLLARLDEPRKTWKFNPGDIRERDLWDQYRKAYEACLGATSTSTAPWYAVPADDKKNARLIVSQVILDAMKQLGMRWPEADKARLEELRSIRNQL